MKTGKNMDGAITKLSIAGFKSIRALENLELKNLNVLVGANGAGKSNFIQVFRMLMAMAQKNFQKFVLENGGADSFLHNGPKVTESIRSEFVFSSLSPRAKGENQYKFVLTPTVNESFLVSEERKYTTTSPRSYGTPSSESRLHDFRNERSHDGQHNGVGHFVYRSIASWMVYHFHDTSNNAAMRRSEIVEDSAMLRNNASNIAPFLLRLKKEYPKNYAEIVSAIRMVMPFFDDFILDTVKMGEAEKAKLTWRQKGSDYPMQPYHLSDGSIRFICLATALLQPELPKTIIIDEPELGLHPEGIALLAELVHGTAQRTQVIISTQSPALVDHFCVEDIIVVNRKNGASTFERLKEQDFTVWLEEYSVGDLWRKNVIAGGTVHE